MKITGSMINYYFVCKRKLWFFLNDIQMEYQNEDVQLGKLIDEESYKREKKNILINETISVDFLKDYHVIHEVKKSKSIEEASEWQLKYYIYYLKQQGLQIDKGVLDYPKLRIRKDVYLTKEDEDLFINIIREIEEIKDSKAPCKINKKFCKKCAYYEMCYI